MELEKNEFKNVILDRLKNRPSSGGRFVRFMINNHDNLAMFSRSDWYNLYEEIRTNLFHGLYDFTFFGSGGVGINMIEEFFSKSNFTRKEYLYFKNSTYLRFHPPCSLSMEDVNKVIKIRKDLLQKGLILYDVEYVNCSEHQPHCYELRKVNLNVQESVNAWSRKIANQLME